MNEFVYFANDEFVCLRKAAYPGKIQIHSGV